MRRLRLGPLLHVPALFAVSLTGALVVVHAALLQIHEMAWLRASTESTPLADLAPSFLIVSDPQAWDLRARWLSLQSVHVDGQASEIALLYQSVAAAQSHVQARPQWSLAWLNWARISARLHPAGKEWQAALRRALSLGDRGWAFQLALSELMLHYESFMDPETRAAAEKSLLLGMSESSNVPEISQQQGFFSALCAEPVSGEAKRICSESDDAR